MCKSLINSKFEFDFGFCLPDSSRRPWTAYGWAVERKNESHELAQKKKNGK